jgi:hypothetical protein
MEGAVAGISRGFRVKERSELRNIASKDHFFKD